MSALDEIRSLVDQGESEVLELKSTTGQRSAAAETLCAMLNNQGGTVLFGVDPGGKLVGQQVGARTIEEISGEIQHIEPSVYPTVKRVPVVKDREIVVVRVPRGPDRPYTYREHAYTRVGNTTVRMTKEAFKQMLLESMHKVRRWEKEPATGWSIDDLDMNQVEWVVAEAIRLRRLRDLERLHSPMDLLTGLGVVEDGELLRAGVVLFGKPDRFLPNMPQCLLRLARFRGVDKREFIDNRQFHGNAFLILDEAERFLASTLPIASRFEPGRIRRIDTLLYPHDATREAFVNAICHRDYIEGGGSIGVAVYDDRLEVISSGRLHFDFTPENLLEPHPSKPWNPLIAKVFYLCGIIEQWGRGIALMTDRVAEAGLPKLEIEDRAGDVTVRFRRNGDGRSSNGDGTGPDTSRDAIVRQLEQTGRPVRLGELSSPLEDQLSARQLRRKLEDLRAQGVVGLTGKGRGARWSLTGKKR